MGAKSNVPNGERLGPEPIPAQSSSRHLSNDQIIGQPFNEWHPHRMKTASRNHPVGRKASMVALSLLGYNAAVPQLQKTRGEHRLIINLGGESLVANRPAWTKVRPPQGLPNS